MPGVAANAAQIEYWNSGAGETWAAMQRVLDDELGPLSAVGIALLSPRPDERIIDIGCGCGATSLDLAKAVGPGGGVLGADISAPMLAVARQRASEQGLAQARFLQADAQVHPFEAGAFDGVFSRFGVMFFEDPAAAFSNIRHALKPGGRLVFVCWRAAMENPWMTLPAMAALRHLPPLDEAVGADGPGPFAFADPDRVRGILAAAGFDDVAIKPHDQEIGPRDMEDAVQMALRIGPLGRRLRENPEKVALVVGAVRDALAPFERPEGVLLPSATWMVTATSPA